MKSKYLVVIFTVLFPFALHGAIWLDRMDWAVGLLGILIFNFFLSAKNSFLKVFGLVGAVVTVILLFTGKFSELLNSVVDIGAYVIYMPSIVISLMMCWLFGRTLLPGNEPIITKFSRIISKDIVPETIEYTRLLTWLWCGFFAFVVIESIALALFTSMETWSFFINVLNYVFIMIFFIGEIIYRRYRLKRNFSVVSFLKALATADYQRLGRS